MRTRIAQAGFPLVLLCVVLIAAIALILSEGKSVDLSAGYALMEYFATIGPVALGFGLAMLAGQFDLSISSMFGLGGILAVQTGSGSWELGLIVALAVGAGIGVVQGGIVSRLRIPSLPVTLGGLVAISGLEYVLTNSKSVAFADYGVGLRLTDPVLQVLSIRSLVVLGIFVVIALILRYTRLGRDVYATGGNPVASANAGIKVGLVTVGVLALSGALTALSGGLVAYTLSAAAPGDASNPLIPAAIAAVIGGIGTSGGRGSVAGILAGVLTLSVINTAFNVVAAPDFVSDIVYGALLVVAMVSAAPDRDRLWAAAGRVRRQLRRAPAPLSPGNTQMRESS